MSELASPDQPAAAIDEPEQPEPPVQPEQLASQPGHAEPTEQPDEEDEPQAGSPT